MGWKGALRSVRASVRAAEREAKRRQRELERQLKEQERLEELELAALQVAEHETYLEILTSVHKDCSVPVDWHAMLTAEEPLEPSRHSAAENAARAAADEFSPGLMDRLLKREEAKRADLETEVERARMADSSEYQRAVEEWRQARKDWEDGRELAKRVLSQDPESLIEAIKVVEPFSEIGDLGSAVNFCIEDDGPLEAIVSVHSDAVIPNESLSLLKSGRLSTKQMPKGKFNELFQDYVCGCVLRVANELFALLPVDAVVVTAEDTLLDTATGHVAPTPIVSAYIPRETLDRMNLDLLDPSDSMVNFIHRMSFKKTKGFEGVKKLTSEDLPAS